jgi:hypothetical protein
MLHRSLYSNNFTGSIGYFIEHFKVKFELGSSGVGGPVGGLDAGLGLLARLLLVELER